MAALSSRSLPLLVPLLVLALLAASAPAAQERVRLDRRLHFDRFEETRLTRFSGLYDHARFLELEGRTYPPARIEEIRAEWLAELARVEALLAEKRADPRTWAFFELDYELARHEFFSKIGMTKLEDVEGFVFYVQHPKREDPGYAERVARESAARLIPLRELFQRDYVLPAGLSRREDFPLDVVIVLASAADQATYKRIAKRAGHHRVSSDYFGRIRAAVLFEDPFDRSITPADKDAAARHAYAHLLLHAHDHGATTSLQEDWLREGLASYLGHLVRDEQGRWSPEGITRDALRLFVAEMHAPRTALVFVRRIGELVSTASYPHVVSRVQADLRRAEIPEDAVSWSVMWGTHFRHALFLVDFLHGEEHRARFLRLLATELEGEHAGLAAFRGAFADVELGELDRAFLTHLLAEHRRLSPDVGVSDAAVEAILAQDAALLPGGAAKGSPAGTTTGEPGVELATGAPPRPAFLPHELAPRDLGARSTRALALDLARRGRTGEAQGILHRALQAGGEEPEQLEQLARLEAQLGAWNRLRTAWLEQLAASGGTLRVEQGGRTLRLPVTGVADGVATLADNRAGLAELELDALDARELARQMGRDADALPDGWARALPLVLAGDARALRGLDRQHPVQATLAEDAAEHVELLAAGKPLGELLELSRLELPETRAGAEALLARVVALVQEHGQEVDVAAAAGRIREYSRLVLGALFDAQGPKELVRGKWEDLPRGRVRITYDFAQAAQLLDFVRDDAYRADRRRALCDKTLDRTNLVVRGGELVAEGSIGLRHRLGFASPRVRYEVMFTAPDSGEPRCFSVYVGVCDQPRGGFIGVNGGLDLEVVFPDNTQHVYAEFRPPMFHGTWLEVDLSVEPSGRTILQRNGEPQQELDAGGGRSGGVFLHVHSDLVAHVRTLVLEGLVEDEHVAAFRESWIEARLEERGL